MDFKGKFIIALCLGGMGINMYFMQKNAEEQSKIAAAKAVLARDQAAVVATAKPAEDSITASADKTATPSVTAPEQTHEIKAGSVTYVFSTKGGGVQKAVLGAQDKITLNIHGKDAIGALRSDPKEPDTTAYKIVEATGLRVVFEGQTQEGLGVRKTFSLNEGVGNDEHQLNLQIVMTNNGTTVHKSDSHWLYTGTAETHNPEDPSIPPSFFINNAGNMEIKPNTSLTDQDGWFSKATPVFNKDFEVLRYGGVMSRFYATIISTKEGADQPGKFWATRFLIDHSGDAWKGTKGADTDYAVQAALALPPLELAPAATKIYDLELYTGPKEFHRLRKLGRQRDFVMDYGTWLWPVKYVLINLLRWFYDLVGSWGMAIVLLTIVVKTFLWWPQMKAQKSMKRMSKLSPMMKDIQTKYKDDQQRQSQEMMKLYKDYGVNPVGGCLPIFIQMPIFFGLLGILQVCAELRGQSFLWVNDLSLPDKIWTIPGLGWPLNPLPILMGLTQVLMMKIMPQPATVDKMQQRMMTFMPFIFVIICYNFASALALYYTVQNIYSLVQTLIMQKFNKDDDAPLQKIVHVPAGSTAEKKKDKKPGLPQLGGGNTSSRGKK